MRDPYLQYGTIGRRCYELRQQGLTWPEIVNKVYRRKYRPEGRSAMYSAKSFARTNNLPWPPEMPAEARQRLDDLAIRRRLDKNARIAEKAKMARGKGTIGRQCYMLRRRGFKWHAVALKVYGCESIDDWPHESEPYSLAILQARHFARRYKLTWPPRTTQ